MTYKVSGWYDPEADNYRVRIRTLTEPVNEHPEMDGVYRRLIGEYMLNEFNLDPNPDTFTRLDLAEDDETVPESERGYTYYEMTS